jgi:hypothetical protein
MDEVRSFFTFDCDLEELEGRVQIAGSAIVRHATHAFVRLVRGGCDFAAIKINGQRDIARIRQLRSLFLNPIVGVPTVRG